MAIMQATGWMSVEAAREAILSRIVAVTDTVTVPIEQALMRVVANNVISPLNVPGHDNSAMDGFACQLSDVSGGDKQLRVIGESFAGHPFEGRFVAGECVRIMTGARLPAGTDVVVPQEETRYDKTAATTVLIMANDHRSLGLNTRRAGEDLMAGDIAVTAGQLCFPAEVGLLSSLGVGTVAVKRPLRVAFFSTGDEIRTAGEKLGASDVYDSNRHTLRAMIERMGFEALDFGIVRDDVDELARTVDQAREADVIVTSGGASVGEADYIRTVLAERGQVLFWKVAMRPGRPLAYGKIGNTDFFGLPGNPVSVMVCFYQFVREALWRRAGRGGSLAIPTMPATTLTPLRKSVGRTEFQRGYLSQSSDGQWQVTVTGDQGSGILSSMTRANCFIVLPETSHRVDAGETVLVQLFEGIV